MIINNTCFENLQCYLDLSDNSMVEFVISTKYLGIIQKKTFRNDPERLHLGNKNIYIFSLQELQLVQQLYLFFLLLLRN